MKELSKKILQSDRLCYRVMADLGLGIRLDSGVTAAQEHNRSTAAAEIQAAA
jgi:hypothetical protein